jgi:hypothetical protein
MAAADARYPSMPFSEPAARSRIAVPLLHGGDDRVKPHADSMPPSARVVKTGIANRQGPP